MLNQRPLSTKSLCLIILCFIITTWVLTRLLSPENQPSNNFQIFQTIMLILLFFPLAKYIMQLSLLPFYSLVEKKRHQEMLSPLPQSVSILVPAFNEEVGILRTLTSVIESDFKQLEIIVINDGSTDNTDAIVRAFVNEQALISPTRIIKYLSLENGGKAKALNQGILIACNEIIMTIDADCMMDKHTICQMVTRFNHPNVGAVAGNIVVGNRGTLLALIQQLEYLFSFFLRRADSTLNAVMVIGGAAAAYRKSVLDSVGPFNDNIVTEDIEMAVRVLAAGFYTRFAHNAITYTEAPEKWGDLCKQRLRWKFGRLQTFLSYKTLFFSCDKKHNKYFTWVQLPLAIYAELLLFFQFIIVGLLLFFCISNNNYLPFVFASGFMLSLCALMMLSKVTKRTQLHLVWLAPIAWLLFFVVDLCEWQALFRSVKRLISKRTLQWQTWARVGL